MLFTQFEFLFLFLPVTFAGYFLLAVADEAEAVRIAQACPILTHGATIEVRPIADLCRPMAEVKQHAQK